MSLTNILISWSKSPQYVSNGRERGRERRKGRKKERPEREKVKGKRKVERKRIGMDGDCERGERG